MSKLGWVLVPVIPTDRMLNEFSGIWWPHVPQSQLTAWAKDKRAEELKAYAAMLAVAPSAPVDCSQLDAANAHIRQLQKLLRDKDYELKRAYKKMKYAHDKRREAEAKLASVVTQDPEEKHNDESER
ncbi:hypothetical protein P6F34_gp27 [Pseudomonas phage MiCath]|uniref:Uncharacterized protein n=1 Tax=Pseudomonas phage MiCath TaxID=3003729 RepID=A0AAE9VJV4_9CAUD|nr:hypothetical protein P6F34_gp27 [Pseudomonas phage MiCath]WAX22380.1 hypothetical protein [Pseudomonas phage MiCath]